ncbi:uncharacterized protein E0L32_003356 [Thyridium curvatum]|uniref:Luciferase domain-containing protein n=1 Tax=Thyridium curvatum TaxID=1093900 RepID=A0A507BKQ4_9PEZI|nr:uncharacterized protein E0L32_003356 [Thyridium curvatum]TPX17238.1 hypothetical protein E0L32_003356 [Thyridium curvatum]
MDQAISLANRLTAQARARPYIAAAIAIGALSTAPIFSWAADSYRTYLSLGKGGIPHNLFGWIVQGLAQPFAWHDTTTVRPFGDARHSAALGPHAHESFLGEAGPSLPARAGDRPTVPGFVAPQRQTTQKGAPPMTARMETLLKDLAAANPGLLKTSPSNLEGVGTPALFLADGVELPGYSKRTKGEICHAHGESSSHMILSLADSKEVLERGWGERHPLSGVRGFWPLSYVMVYAPRDDDEFVIWKRLVVACVRFAFADGPAVNVDV